MIIQITTAIGCRNNCNFCPQSQLTKAYYSIDKNAPQYLSLNNFKRILHHIPKNIAINFCGMCEPFQNPKCTEMIMSAYKANYTVMIYTTLMGLTLKNAKIIFGTIPFKYKYQLAIHLPSTEKIENITVNNNYLTILKYILSKVKIIDLHYHGKQLDARVLQVLKKYNAQVKQVMPHNRAGLLKFKNAVIPSRKKGKIGCACWEHVILPNGITLLCSYDYPMKYIIGNIIKSNLNTLHNHAIIKFFQKAFKDDTIETPCRYCFSTYNKNGFAWLYNSPFSFLKIHDGIKIYLYNYFPLGFNFIRKIKHVFNTPPQIDKKYNNWLKI